MNPEPTPAVFKSLEISRFRGFNQQASFDLDASVVVLHGPNGYGKTSFFDALQWVLVGDVQRLRAQRLRTTDEHILNAYSGEQEAEVSAVLRVEDDEVTITRTGNRSDTRLRWTRRSTEETLVGRDAEAALTDLFLAAPGMTLEQSLNACGHVQQDASRLMLQMHGHDKYQLFAQLLGLAELEEFEAWVETRDRDFTAKATSAKQALREAQTTHQREQALVAQLLESQQPGQATSDLESQIRAAARASELSLAPFDSRDRAVALTGRSVALSRDAATLARDIQSFLDAAPTTSSTTVEEDGEQEILLAQLLANARDGSDAARQQLDQAQSALASMRAAQQDLVRMADAVLPYVTTDHCPICEQPVDPDALRARLTSIAGSLATHELESAVATLQVATDEAHQEVQARQAELSALQKLRQERTARAAGVSELEVRLAALRAPNEVLHIESAALSWEQSVSWLQQVSTTLNTLGAISRQLVVARDAAAPAGLPRAEAALQIATETLAAAQREASVADAGSATSKTLLTAMRQGRLAVVKQQFAQLQPLAQEIYSRLDPHPTFRQLDLEQEMFRSVGQAKANVLDEVRGVSADPMVVFSSAQTNMVALTFVVALNWATPLRAPLLMLDDPLQAMDDVNVLGFADLCRHLRGHRQLILSTHERRFAALLERKLAPRREQDRTIVLEFVGWDRQGPQIKHYDLPNHSRELATFLDPSS